MRSKAQGTLTRLAALPLAAALLISLIYSGAGALAQAKKPISRKGLTEAVRINGLSTAELIRQIGRRGVDFEVTANAEQDLLAAGARPEIIEAARQNYRPRAATTTAPNTKTTAPRPITPPPSARVSGPPVPPGSPLSKNEIVTMLQGGISPSRVEQFVEARGVSFTVTPDIAREITAAGGTRSLVGAITEKSTEEVAETSSPFDDSPFDDSAAGRDAGPNYDDLMDRMQSAMSSNDLNSAVRYAQQAVQLDPSQPTAYSFLGAMLLYGKGDIASAEQAMRAAIERGGAAAFKVYHDHADGSFDTYCEGSFFVTKSGVSFKANDGRDTFETADSNIKEVKTNAFVGAQYGAFHIKPIQKINDRGNFNFAPATKLKVEAQLIIRLLQGY